MYRMPFLVSLINLITWTDLPEIRPQFRQKYFLEKSGF